MGITVAVVVKDYPNYRIFEEGYIENVKTGKKLKTTPSGKMGTLRVVLRNDKGKKQFSLARLVAKHFVPNDNCMKYRLVGHKDLNQNNNSAKNLFWTDRKGILSMYPDKIQNRSRKTDSPVMVYNLYTNEIFDFPRMTDAAKFIGCSYSTIKNVIWSNRIHYKGWMIEKK